jgi:hypothetical protein
MREIRPSGSVRGVWSNPYPYRDPILPVQSTAAMLAAPMLPDGATDASKPPRRTACGSGKRTVEGEVPMSENPDMGHPIILR